MPVEAPPTGDAEWTRQDTGKIDLSHVTGLGLAADSWGGEPFTVWLDGLSVE